ncbi:MAG: peptidoglycan-binding protein [Clostridia bacterium]|nr:peptidoglycan-binding protein [Clostridia bacterium]
MRRALAGFLMVCALWAGNVAAARAMSEADRAAFVDRIAFIEEFIAVADGEVGYEREAHGYTKYADWSGGNKYGEWCSDFVSWCVAQTDLRLSTFYLDFLYPMQTACITGVRWYTDRGRYVTATGELKGFGDQWYRDDGVPLAERPYIPQRGDLVYFEWFQYNRIDHVGIVEYVTMDAGGAYRIHTIEGNNRVGGVKIDAVERFSYPLDDPAIRAFGVTRDEVGTTLSPGSAGPLVTRLQQLLVEAGFAGFRPDGVYGSRTTRAIRELQEVYGLEVTGVADRATQMVLGFPNGKPLPRPTPVPEEDVENGG